MPDDGTNVPGHNLHIVRLSFEARSPLSIGSRESRKESRKERGSGVETRVSVSEIQRDANALPAIPGAGLQGVLCRLAAEVHGEEFASEMFGREDAGGDGAAGRVLCGWACIHDADGTAVSGLRLAGLDTSDDDVLRLLTRPEPLWRDHVALNDRHSVDDRRKFARAAVPVGTRFSVELSGWGDDAFRDKLIEVVSLFRHPRLRFGAGSGRGYGRIRLLAASHEAPSLDDPAALRRLRGQPPSESLSTDVLGVLGIPTGDDADTVLTLHLRCTDLLRIGAVGPHAQSLTHDAQRARCATSGGIVENDDLGPPERQDGDAILTLLREPRIVWNGNRGRSIEIDDDPGANPAEQLRFPVPGSSIRGTMAHRMLFHANRSSGRCIDADAWHAEADEERREALQATYDGYRQRPPDLEAFLGAVKESTNSEDVADDSGRAGRVLFDDAEAIGVGWIVGLDHVSIDRFTGGAQDGALFREETLLGGRIEATVTIRPPLEPAGGGEKTIGGWPEATANAFLLAVRDLCRVGSRSRVADTGSARVTLASREGTTMTGGGPHGTSAFRSGGQAHERARPSARDIRGLLRGAPDAALSARAVARGGPAYLRAGGSGPQSFREGDEGARRGGLFRLGKIPLGAPVERRPTAPFRTVGTTDCRGMARRQGHRASPESRPECGRRGPDGGSP